MRQLTYLRLHIFLLFAVLVIVPVQAQDEVVFPQPLEPITAATASRLQQLAVWGRGRLTGNIAWSPDGTTLAVGTTRGIWLYDANDLNAEPRLSTGHSQNLRDIVFSPDGSLIAAASSRPDSSANVWDVATGEQIYVLAHGQGNVSAVDFSPNGGVLVSAGIGSSAGLRLWDLSTGDELAFWRESDSQGGTMDDISTARFSPDGRYVAFDTVGREIVLWDVATRSIAHQLESDRSLSVSSISFSPVTMLSFSPDGSHLASADFQGMIQIWDMTSLQLSQVIELPHISQITQIEFSPDGDSILSAGSNSTNQSRMGHVWDTTTGDELVTLRGHTGHIRGIVFSPNGSQIASVSFQDGTVRIWDAESGIQAGQLPRFKKSAEVATFTPDGRRILAAYGRGGLSMWDAVSGEEAIIWEDDGQRSSIRSMAFIPNTFILVYSTPFVVGWLNIETGDEQILAEIFRLKRLVPSELQANSNYIPRLIQLAHVGSTDGQSAVLYESALDLTRARINTLANKIGDSQVDFIHFSPDQRFVAGANDEQLVYWDTETNVLVQGLHEIPRDLLTGITLNIDSTLLLTMSSVVTRYPEPSLRLWDVSEEAITKNQSHFRQGQELATVPRSPTRILGVAFSPDGKLMAQTDTDGILQLWGVPTRKSPTHILLPALLGGLIAFLLILRLLVPMLEPQEQSSA